MSRSSRKGPYVDPRLFKRVMMQIQSGEKKILRTWSRNCDIPPEFVGFTFAVHNGKDFIPVYVTEQMVGHKLGEFSFTRKFRVHGGKMAKAEEQAAGAPGAPGAAPAATAAPAASSTPSKA
jgi:small subunit ribosomal protein S19